MFDEWMFALEYQMYLRVNLYCEFLEVNDRKENIHTICFL